MQGRLNLLLLVSGATAVTLTFGLAPEGQVLSAAVASVVFNVLFELLRSRQVKQYSANPTKSAAARHSHAPTRPHRMDDAHHSVLEQGVPHACLANDQLCLEASLRCR